MDRQSSHTNDTDQSSPAIFSETKATEVDISSKDDANTFHEKVIFECQWDTCTETFTNDISFLNHIDMHVTQRPWVCLWRGCKSVRKSFTEYRSTLLQHIILHTNYRPYCCAVPDCSFSTPFIWCLQKHNRAHVRTGTTYGKLVRRKKKPITENTIAAQKQFSRPSTNTRSAVTKHSKAQHALSSSLSTSSSSSSMRSSSNIKSSSHPSNSSSSSSSILSGQLLPSPIMSTPNTMIAVPILSPFNPFSALSTIVHSVMTRNQNPLPSLADINSFNSFNKLDNELKGKLSNGCNMNNMNIDNKLKGEHDYNIGNELELKGKLTNGCNIDNDNELEGKLTNKDCKPLVDQTNTQTDDQQMPFFAPTFAELLNSVEVYNTEKKE